MPAGQKPEDNLSRALGRLKQLPTARAEEKRVAVRRMLLGLTVGVVGFVISLVSMMVAGAVGGFVVLSGAILWGGVTFVRGLAGWLRYRDAGGSVLGIVVAFAAVVLVGLLGLGAAAFWLARSAKQDVARSPAEAAFRAADSRILTAAEGRTVLGNTPEAQQLGERFQKLIEPLAEISFTGGGRKGGPSLTGNRFLIHCELRNDRVCFLVHVPQLRNYRGDVRDSLIRLAWMCARQATSELRKDADRKLAVGLRGSLLYGGLAVGQGNSKEPSLTKNESTVDAAPLYEFFEGPPAPAAAIPPAPAAAAEPMPPSATASLAAPSPGQTPHHISLDRGDGQTVAAGTWLDFLIVRVVDTESKPVPGARVRFVVLEGEASFFGEPRTSETRSNALGLARDRAVLGKNAGTVKIEAQLLDAAGAAVLSRVTFTATATR